MFFYFFYYICNVKTLCGIETADQKSAFFVSHKENEGVKVWVNSNEPKGEHNDLDNTDCAFCVEDMQSLKFKYCVNNEYKKYIDDTCTQYGNMLRCAYNRVKDGFTQKQVEDYLTTLNNIDNVKDSIVRRSCFQYAEKILKLNSNKPIFGGRKNFFDRMKGLITKEEYKENRKIYWIIGETSYNGNRRFWINKDLKSFIFRPNRHLHIELKIDGEYKKYKKILERLYQAQELKEIPITYTLNNKEISLSFDESILKEEEYKPIENRIFGIDMNPNYIGYSVVDWKLSNEFKVIESGTISIKEINDRDFALKGKGFSNQSKERKYLTNKRRYEIFEISKRLVNLAKHYHCEYFSFEELNIKSKDTNKGLRFNKLVNNCWNREKFVSNIRKRCNIIGIGVQEVAPQYSSFVGNILYRELNRPDMELASIEIGRRCYEFVHQYIKKDRNIKKNIVTPSFSDFKDRIDKSLEEFGIQGEVTDLVELYNLLKKSKYSYRLSLNQLGLEFSRCFSRKALVNQNYCLTFKNLFL